MRHPHIPRSLLPLFQERRLLFAQNPEGQSAQAEVSGEKPEIPDEKRDSEKTLNELADLKKRVEEARKNSQFADPENDEALHELTRDYEARQKEFNELLNKPNISEHFRNTDDMQKLLMLDEASPGALKDMFAREVEEPSFGPGKSFVVEGMGSGTLADSSMGLGMMDFREGGQGEHPRFVLVQKPDGTMQIGSRDIKEYTKKGKPVERVGYYDANGDYLEIHNGYKFKISSNKEELTAIYENYRKEQGEDAVPALDPQVFADRPPLSSERERTANEGFANFSRGRYRRGEEVLSKLNELPAEGFAKVLMEMPADDMADLRDRFGSNKRAFEAYLNSKDVDLKMTAAAELATSLDGLVSSSEFQELKAVYGGEKAFKKICMQLADQESGYRPFAISSTGCAGPYQFNRGNGRNYEINPFNIEQAARGAMQLMTDNMDYLKQRGYSGAQDLGQRIIIAHNRGAGAAANQNLASIGRDQYGNPAATNYYRQVANRNVPEFMKEGTQAVS